MVPSVFGLLQVTRLKGLFQIKKKHPIITCVSITEVKDQPKTIEVKGDEGI